MNMKQHFQLITDNTKTCYDVAKQARAKGFDPVSEIETPIATSLAEKSLGLISTIYPQLNDEKIAERIIEFEGEYGQLDPAVAFKIAEEIAKEKFCKFKDLMEAIDAGIRVGFAYITLGVVSSPLEGFTGIELGKTKEGKEYFIASFSGPIRSAGTTASCVVLMLIDYLRETFGFARYDPDETEVKRYVTENYDYHDWVTNLQYLPTEDEITFLAKNLPIQIGGEPTEKREVSNYKDLPRVKTNFIRGGMCLIFSEGLAQKAQKGLRLYKSVKDRGIHATGFDHLDEYIMKYKKKAKGGKSDNTPVYIKDIVAGRPVFSHPSRSGGFRFRYGRSRTGGFSATLVHPATMAISNCFLSSGTQLKIEKPTKGCAITVCDSIEGPTVKMKDGSVKQLTDFEEAKQLYRQVEEIIYLGDLLFPFGDVLNRNYELIKPGYVEEWWGLELEKKLEKPLDFDLFSVSFADAIRYSMNYGVPLHPNYIYYWTQITKEQFLGLIDFVSHGEISEEKLILPYTQKDKERFVVGKRALELLAVPHEITTEHIVISEHHAPAFLFNIGINIFSKERRYFADQIEDIAPKVKAFEGDGVLKLISVLCPLRIKDKAGSFIGARMGRPEKAKLRKLTGSPHVLFPVGDEGGRLRSFQAAMDIGHVRGEFPNYTCKTCQKDSVYLRCDTCGNMCERFEEDGIDYSKRKIPVRDYFNAAKKLLNVRGEDVALVKGVRGTSNKDHSTEHLAKGLLRAKHNLNVNKDGTIRYDMTEMAITHFKPKEVGTSVAKLIELGYDTDITGKKLESDDQVLQLFPHDVILPSCPHSPDEHADDVFMRIMNFVDDELEKIYGLPRFYNVKTKEDTVGHLVVCIAPHICTASVGRIVGYSKIQALLASPYMHAAMRRDCDGDEAASLLLMDMLLNFSKKFLPAHRGGTQDSPLVLNTHIQAGEVDDQILDFILGKYPLSLYEKAEQGKHSSEVELDTVKSRLKNGENPFEHICYTHECTDFNAGVLNSSYKLLPTMQEKVSEQMDLCTKIRAVDTNDVSRLVIERHFIRDTRGNLRKFSMQVFRCVGCNAKYRRPPLVGKCVKCGGKIIFTISEGSIMKYMQPALDLARTYNVSPYLLESLELTEMYIQSIFGKEKEKQEAISKWF